MFQSRSNKNGYIVTQMPMKNTIMDFWRLIYDHGSNVIVALTALDEDREVGGVDWWIYRLTGGYMDCLT